MLWYKSKDKKTDADLEGAKFFDTFISEYMLFEIEDDLTDEQLSGIIVVQD